MTDLDDRLDHELSAIARALVADAPDALPFSGGSRSPGTQHHRGMLVAAAAIAAVGAVGVLAVSSPDGADRLTPSDAIESGVPGDDLVTMPALYPVIDDLPDSGFAHVLADELGRLGGQGPQAAAVVGKVGDDGSISSTLTIAAGLQFADQGEPTDSTSVFGVAASVFDESEVGGPAGRRTVAWGTPPLFASEAGLPFLAVIGQPAIAGADPIDFLAAVDPSFATFTAGSATGPVDVQIGDLPDGFRLLAGPESIGRQPWIAYLRTGNQGPFAQTTASNPLYGYVGPLAATTVNGVDGWIADEGRAVVWPVGESTWARVLVEPGDDPVAFAESIRFVDWDTWSGLYDATAGYPDPDFMPITGPFDYPEPGFDCTGCDGLNSEQQQLLEEYISSLPGGTIGDL